MNFKQPEFLSKGVFAWNALGYRFAAPAPPDLMESAALLSNNPWMVLGAVLQLAKAGGFKELHRLIHCMRQSTDWVLSRDCALLLGDAGTSAYLKRLHQELKESEVDQEEIANCFSGSGLLWTVPIMLEAHLRMPAEHSVVSVLLSPLLEKGFGVVSHGQGPPGQGPLSDKEYRSLVMQKYDELVKQLGTAEVPVLYGQLFSVQKVARHLYESLQEDAIQTMIVRDLRHRFEASTGIDCSGFFKEGRLQLLTATAIVEDFLESKDLDKYQDGVRYFFGHRIPD
jgi:hypothetical protein